MEFTLSPIFEYTNFIVEDKDGYENRLNPYSSYASLTTFGPSMSANFILFNLQGNRLYNFYINPESAVTPSSGHVKVTIFNSSVQLTATDPSIFTMDTLNNPTVQWLCPADGIYGALIEPYFTTDFHKSIDYNFWFSACPLPCTILQPLNNTFYAHTDLSTSTQPLLLNWSRSLTDSSIYYYQLEIYNNETFSNTSLVENDSISGINTQTYQFNMAALGHYYWRVRAVDNANPNDIGQWSSVGEFNYLPVAPDPPFLHFLPRSNDNGSITLSWDAAYDGGFTVPLYFIYYATQPVFVNGVPPSSTYIFQPLISGTSSLTVVIPNLKNYLYYFAVVAQDEVFQNSNISNVVNITVAVGGYISALNQTLTAQVGDTFQYVVSYVQSNIKDVNSNPLMTFDYQTFLQGTQFHFWVQSVDKSQVYPVLGQFYYKNPFSYDTIWHLGDINLIPMTIFAMTPDINYEYQVTALWVKNNLPDSITNHTIYQTLWRSGVNVHNVNVITFTGPSPSGIGNNASVSFFIEQSSGVLCNLVYYSPSQSYGYSLELMETSLTLTNSDWSYAPIYFILAVAAVGVAISFIIKKVEF
jgi:hypothetical protein